MTTPRKPHVTEYVTADGTAVVWLVWDGARHHVRMAVKSPLTGWWLTDALDGPPPGGQRRPTLRAARQQLLGGNGHRYRGHSNVTEVVTLNVNRHPLRRVALTVQ